MPQLVDYVAHFLRCCSLLFLELTLKHTGASLLLILSAIDRALRAFIGFYHIGVH